MTKELFITYAKLKAAEKELKAQIDEMSPQVLEAMGDNDEVELEGYGTFVRANRRSWTYPQPIQQAEADLKVAKKTSEQTGEASYEENPYLRFNIAKD